MNIFLRAITVFFLFLFACSITSKAQTPGMIIKPASGAGAAVLDPDGDGYVSKKSGGVQLGFTNPPNNDLSQSELPYVQLIKPDPVADIYAGPTGSFNEIVGVDVSGNNAIMTYTDGTNLLYRFRLDQYRPNSKSYSILIDVDGKFGFTGSNADPNAITGNPGFEVEINLVTNFRVDAFNIDGTTNGTLITSVSWLTNCQQAYAVTNTSGDLDLFYDFYLPLSSLSAYFTTSTPLRYAAVTSMNTHSAMGNNAISDVGGTTTGSNDAAYADVVNQQTPSTPGEVVLTRSDCPTINDVSSSATSITGTSTEASGTLITVKVYQSDGVTLIGSGTTTTAGSSWTINVSALSPSVTLASGQIVKATAKATDEGTSIDNCSSKTVTSCGSGTSTSGVTITKISGNKGYTLTNAFPTGTIITWYNADYSLAVFPDKNGSLVNITNPVTTTAPSQTVLFSTQTGQTFPFGVYYFTYKAPGQCTSSYVQDCQYSTAGTSVVPVISTSPITTATTSLSGTCGTSAATVVNLFINGVQVQTSTVTNGAWSFTGLNLTTRQCDTILVQAGDAGKCPTPSAAVYITRQASAPVISGGGCYASSPVTSIGGTSVENDGATVTLYTPNTSGTVLGTATVTSGLWTVTGLSITSGTTLVAAVTAGSCLRNSVASDAVVINTKTSLSPYTITITAPTEGQASVTGTLSGGTYPTTLRLYLDQTQIGADLTVNAAGSWTVSGLLSSDLYTSGILNITLTNGSSCESALSAATATVRCLNPSTPTYTGGSISYCIGGSESVTITGTQALTVYQFVDSTGASVGPSAMGNGGSITLYSNALFTDVKPVYVKAYKLLNNTCNATASTPIYFEATKPTPTITLSSTSLTVLQGTTSVNLPFSAKSGSPSADNYTIDYALGANSAGFVDVTTSTAIPSAPGNISLTVPVAAALGTYSATITVTSTTPLACTRTYDFTITVYSNASIPIISVQPSNKTICSGTTTTLTVTAVNATSYQWQSATAGYSGPYSNVVGGSGATTASYTTPALSTKTFYRVIVSNANGSVTSEAASVFINTTPTAGAISGTTTLCAGETKTYSISALSDATSYTWSYSGTGATLTASTNSVSIVYGQTATSGTLSVTGNNACGAGTAATVAITVNAAPFINNMTKNTCNAVAFTVTPVNTTNGVVPSGTTYSWSAPVVTGGITGGASGSGASAVSGTLTNPTTSIQTATYTVTPVKGSCTGSTFTVIVSVNPTITITPTATNLLCKGVTTGSINTAVSGGTPSYTYAWSKLSGYSASTQNISSLDTGTYTLTVTDSRSCTQTSSTTITQPTLLSITPTVTNVLCNGNSTGAFSISVSGGTTTYSYLWSDGSSSQNRTNLAAGSYKVVVTDANGCKDSVTQSVTQPTALSGSAAASAILCNGGASTITVTASGGTGTLTYSLNGGSFQSSNLFTSQTASATPYAVTVKDANNCTLTASVTITQPVTLSLSTSVTNESCPGKNDGAIDLTITGGTSPFNKDWADMPGTNNAEDRTGLTAGTYSVTVTDTNGCSALTSATITSINPNPVTPTSITK